jgi:L-threonylcarbamoyladenylate synthase
VITGIVYDCYSLESRGQLIKMRLLKFTKNNDELIKLLIDGAVGVMPTDTIYGLVCSASDEKAVRRLYAHKSRENKPGTVIAANIDQLVDIGVKRRYLKAVEQFWPGAVSIEIPNSINYLNQSTGRQAFRIPKDSEIQSILLKTGPLLTTSANNPGETPSNTINEAKDYFKDSIDFYVDGGDLSNRAPSTIIRVIDDAIEVVRQGSVII